MLFANSPVPLYKQLYDQLRQSIESGKFDVGNRLPSERQLAAEFGISRLTARRALGLLQQDGYIHAHQGKGSYVVRSQPRTQRHTKLQGFTEVILRRGMQPSRRVVSCDVIAVNGEVAHSLGVKDNDQAVKIRRLHLANGMPVALFTSYLPYPLCAPVLNRDLEQHSLYRMLEEELHIHLAYADHTSQKVLERSGDLHFLNLEPPATVIQLKRKTCDDSGRVVEYLEALCHSSRYRPRHPELLV